MRSVLDTSATFQTWSDYQGIHPIKAPAKPTTTTPFAIGAMIVLPASTNAIPVANVSSRAHYTTEKDLSAWAIFFRAHFEAWKQETQFQSRYRDIVDNTNYIAITRAGRPMVPFILRELQNGEGPAWFQTLREMTRVDPVLLGHDTVDEIREDWIKWGKGNGLI